MTTLDRYILRTLFVHYAIALAVMLSLYMVLDLFINIDEFTESGDSATILARIASYYGAHLFRYFSQLSGVITLFACTSALNRLRRANELTAALASGLSLYRIGVPVVAFGLATTVVWYIDAEVIIPKMAHLLARNHEDAAGKRSRGVWLVNDGPTALLSAQSFVPVEKRLNSLLVLNRTDRGTIESVIEAEEATWRPIPGHPVGGVWDLLGGTLSRQVHSSESLGPQSAIDLEEQLTYESHLNPAALEARQTEQWLEFTSSAKLAALDEQEPVLAERIRRVRHKRFATPLVHMLMLLLGLPFFLSREPSNVVIDSTKCLAVCGLCYFIAYSGDNLVRSGSFSALPAWLPILIFAPVAVVLIDRIRT